MKAVAQNGDDNLEIVKAMIEAKADVKATDSTGKSALHWAAEKNRKNLVELLVKAGADVNVQAKDGTTPLGKAKFASANGSRPTPPMPIGYQLNSSTAQTVTTNELSIADFLRQHGALDALPDFTRIRITRQGVAQPLEVFNRSATLTNRFTLLETVMSFYSHPPSIAPVPGQPSRRAWEVLPFPDFGRVIIRRPSQKIDRKSTHLNSSHG